jgi:hypothetical protein
MGCILIYNKASQTAPVDTAMRKSGASNLQPVKCDSFPDIFPTLNSIVSRSVSTLLTLHELNDPEVRSVLKGDTTRQLCYFVNQLED